MDNDRLSQRPTLRQLEYAVAVADHMHFGRAARAAAVTQPGLSAQLQALEALLSVRLFERDRRRVLLTPEGAELIERARVVLRAADDLVDVARSSRDALRGTLRLGVIPTVAPYLLPLVLPEVRTLLPELKLVLLEDQTARIVRRLREGSLDVCLIALPEEGDDLEATHVVDEPFVLLLPRGHALANHEKPARLADLARAGGTAAGDSPVLLLDEGHCLRDQALDVCKRAGARAGEGLRATSLPTLVQMVANGLGVTLLPKLAVPVEVRSGTDLVVRPFRPPAPRRVLGLVWRRASGRRSSLRRLAEILARRAREVLESDGS